MGKHEVGTPKFIANKIKAKGLQKLRWYCQMCQKQCRDENGFKCHTMSESHHRQLLLFADNATRYMDQFSREFSQGYLNLLKRQFGTRRVPANRVYQEYISDRGHIHMNATIWLTLTGFVKWLGRTGQCIVDETEKGWYVTYIDRDPETIAAQEKKAKKQKMDKDDEERLRDFIEKQVEKGRTEVPEVTEESKVPLMRSENDGPLVLDLKLKPKPKPVLLTNAHSTKTESKGQLDIKLRGTVFETKDSNKIEGRDASATSRPTKRIKTEHVGEEDEQSQKRGQTNEGGWLKVGLIVKVTTKSLGEKYYRSKGVVQDVEQSGFVGKIKLKVPEELEGHVIKLDQVHVETVIPAIGREVLILWGEHKGQIGIVRKLRMENYSVDVELRKEQRIVKDLLYEQVCKFMS